MSRSAALVPDTEYFDCAGVVAYVHSKGLTHYNERKILRATYEGRKLLKKRKFDGRVYWAREDVDDWISLQRNQSA